MALITCWECGGTVSDTADFCPHCGAKPKDPAKKEEPVRYDIRTERVWAWGTGRGIQKKLQVFADQGWEIVSVTQNPWISGLLRPYYIVTMRRMRKPKKYRLKIPLSLRGHTRRKGEKTDP